MLGEREREDAQPGTPQSDDPHAKPEAVTVIGGLGHIGISPPVGGSAG
jgi:hypothetical protein